jgi:hypothetical protein
MFENYLLDATAIASVLGSELTALSKSAPGVDEVSRWLADHSTGLTSLSNLRCVDAAGLLDELFWDLSGNTVTFVKTKHSPLLTKFLLENNPNTLKELSDLLANITASDSRRAAN